MAYWIKRGEAWYESRDYRYSVYRVVDGWLAVSQRNTIEGDAIGVFPTLQDALDAALYHEPERVK